MAASGLRTDSGSDSPVGRLAREVSSLQASLLAKLQEQMSGGDAEQFASAAQRLAEEFGSVTATAVGAVYDRARAEREQEREQDPPTSLHRSGQMWRRLDQLVEANKRYGHPFGLVVFAVEGPGTRRSVGGGGREMALGELSTALRDSIRLVDESFRLEEDALCVLAPSQTTVEGVQMAERLLRHLDELEAARGMSIAVSAGVVSCPEHGAVSDELLGKADEAMWRARAVGQPVGVGALDPTLQR